MPKPVTRDALGYAGHLKNDGNIICSSIKSEWGPIGSSVAGAGWQTFSMSYTLQIFKNDSFFIDEQMILLSFFDNSNQKSTI